MGVADATPGSSTADQKAQTSSSLSQDEPKTNADSKPSDPNANESDKKNKKTRRNGPCTKSGIGCMWNTGTSADTWANTGGIG